MKKQYTFGHNFTVEEAEHLINALLALKTRREVKLFLKDLLTPQEVEDLARRFWAAKRIFEGKTFEEIRKEIGMGYDTIAKVYRGCIKGKGYKLIFKKLK